MPRGRPRASQNKDIQNGPHLSEPRKQSPASENSTLRRPTRSSTQARAEVTSRVLRPRKPQPPADLQADRLPVQRQSRRIKARTGGQAIAKVQPKEKSTLNGSKKRTASSKVPSKAHVKNHSKSTAKLKAPSAGVTHERAPNPVNEPSQPPLTVEDLYPESNRHQSVNKWLQRLRYSASSSLTPVDETSDRALSSSSREMQTSRETPTPSDSVYNEKRIAGGPGRVTWSKLRTRLIDTTPSDDEKLPELNALLHQEQPKLQSRQITELQAIFETFTQLNVRDVDYAQIELVSNEFDEWKSKAGLASITDKRFLGDVRRCRFASEAVLQRTIMMEIIDRHQLHNFITFNSEGQWRQTGSESVVSRAGDKLTLPKPDLHLGFRVTSFDETAPIPIGLKTAFRPEGAENEDGRCFPFLFFEVKRAKDDLITALLANLNSASQALLNIFAWMSKAEQTEIFFEKVRVFSFVFNAGELLARIHRASPHPRTVLQYHFVDFATFSNYSKGEVCRLLRRILENYAIGELHPILKKTFDIITEEYERAILEKDRKVQEDRSAAFERASAARRARSRLSPDAPVDGSTSFGVSGLTTS